MMVALHVLQTARRVKPFLIVVQNILDRAFLQRVVCVLPEHPRFRVVSTAEGCQ